MTERWINPTLDELDDPIPDCDRNFAAEWAPGGGPDLNLMTSRQLDRYLASVPPRQTPRRDDDRMVTVIVVGGVL